MQQLDRIFSHIADNFSGTFTVYAEHFKTGEVIAFGNSHPMETASTIKLPILITAMQKIHEGHLHMEQLVPLLPDDYVTGSGVLQNLSLGTMLPIADVLMLMIIVSDNMATNMILRLIGLDAINRLMQDLGARNTVIRKRIDFRIPPPIGLSTPKDMVHLLKGIYHRQLVSPAASKWMWDVLTRQQYNTILTRNMPYTLLNSETDDPPQVIIGSKSGSVEGVRNDVGIVTTPWGDYAIAIMSEACQDLRFHMDNEAHRVLPEVALQVFQHFCPQTS